MFEGKVLHLSALDCGTGAANAAARLHSTFCQFGINSKMLVCQQRSAATGVSKLPRPLVQRLFHRLQLFGERRLLKKLHSDYVLSTGFFGHNVSRIVQRESPDLLQLHWIGGMSFRFSSLRGIKVPVVWRMPDMWSFCGTEHLCSTPDRFVEGYRCDNRPSGQAGVDIDRLVWKSKNRTYRMIDRIVFVAPSRWLAKCASESRLLGGKQIEVIPTSCDVDRFKPLDRSASRAVLGIDPDTPVVLTGATCMRTKWKGGDLLVTALNQLASRTDFNARVVCFGQGVEAFQEQCLLPVTSMGSISDSRLMAILYSAADAFVAPSRMENMANTVLESLACGTPAIAFNIGGMPDMIDHLVHGYLARPFETEDLANGIRWAIEEADSKATRHATRERILSRHLPENEANSYLRIYESLRSN